jgi:hypothetical protein
MVLAHNKLIKSKHHFGLRGCVLTFLWLVALDAGSAAATKDLAPSDNPPSFAGYVSQEKRFLMYLLNGNAGKVQVV